MHDSEHCSRARNSFLQSGSLLTFLTGDKTVTGSGQQVDLIPWLLMSILVIRRNLRQPQESRSIRWLSEEQLSDHPGSLSKR